MAWPARAGLLSCGMETLKRLPDVALFLIAGVLLGPQVAGIISIEPASRINQLALTFGACFVLFDGGAALRIHVLERTWISVVVLATMGVLVTAGITTVAAQYFLDVPLVTALLLSSVIASTDPATLIPVFQQVKVRERVAQTVMAESAFNDATGAMLTFAVLGIATGEHSFSLASAARDFATNVIFGIAVGVTLGYAAALVTTHERWGYLGRYTPVVTLMAVAAAYLAAERLDASGFMAVFVFGMVGRQSAGAALSDAGARLCEARALHRNNVAHRTRADLCSTGRTGGFFADERACRRRRARRSRPHLRCTSRNRFRMRPARPSRALDGEGAALHVLDAGKPA